MNSDEIRIADPDRDYDALATFLNHFEPDPIAASDICEWDRRNADNVLRRTVVRMADEGVIGYSVTLQGPWNQPGEFYLWIGVAENHRRQGIGSRLYERALDFVRPRAGTALTTDVGEDDAEGLRFAARRGFHQVKHTFQSRLDLHTFEEAAFADVVESAERLGIRFYTLAEVPDSDEVRATLYQFNRQVSLQDPGSDGIFPTFERFAKDVFEAPWYRPEGQWLAADGDRVVGMCAVGYFQVSNSMYNMMTGVDEAYRGRGIAQALKVLAIRWAKAFGADYIRTNNNSENAPMLAINHKLGYEPQPGIFTLLKGGLDGEVTPEI